jgi:Tfp pilus assembly protein PilN
VTRVNLLRPAPDRRGFVVSPRHRWRVLAACGAFLALTSGGLAWWWSSLHRTSAELDADLLRARQELAQLRTAIARRETESRVSGALLQRIGVLEVLRAGQGTPLAVLEAIGASLPGDCWLTVIAYETASPVRVEGRARQLASIFEFAERLEASRAFDGGVHVVESHLEANDTQGPVVTFSLEALSESRERAGTAAAVAARPGRQ